MFGAKIEKFLMDNQAFFPFINQLHLKVESRNTFPHSSGIASSASSMSAFVMGLIEIENLLVGPSTGSGTLTKASYFSRLASGSAARAKRRPTKAVPTNMPFRWPMTSIPFLRLIAIAF